MKVITFGTYDLLHVGHINILERASKLGDTLIVGVSSDELNYSKKQKHAVYNQDDRMKIIKSIRYVDDVFLEESLEKKKEYITKYKCDILVMGDDWKGKFDDMPCKVLYLERTPDISTASNINKIIYNNL